MYMYIYIYIYIYISILSLKNINTTNSQEYLITLIKETSYESITLIKRPRLHEVTYTIKHVIVARLTHSAYILSNHKVSHIYIYIYIYIYIKNLK